MRVEAFRPAGPGGQAVNRSNSGCRATHVPTGLSASIQEDRSFQSNRKQALQVLGRRVQAAARQREGRRWRAAQKAHAGTGDWSEKIRTYHYPAERVTDHLTGLVVGNLPRVLDGDLGELVEATAQRQWETRLRDWLQGPG